jgi:hypothetical protein
MDNLPNQVTDSSVEVKDNNILQVELSKFVKVSPSEKEDRKGFVTYGDQNDFQQYLVELYQESPVHSALINSISFMISGDGLTSSISSVVSEVNRLELEKLTPLCALDLKLQGGFCIEVIWSLDRSRPAKVNHLPFENIRLGVSDENDEVCGIWYSRDWSDTRKKKNIPEYIPFFDVDKKDNEARQVLYVSTMSVGSIYYPKPDYFGALNYVELARHIGEYHINNILNGLFPSFIINFANGVPSPERQNQIKRNWENMISGVRNSGKFIMTFNEDQNRTPKIDAFPLSDADKQYQFLSEETTKQIMYAHRVTSPLLFGIRDSSGLGSNSDEIKSSYHIFNMQVIQPYQKMIETAFNTIIEASGLPADITIIPNDFWAEKQVISDDNATSSAPAQQDVSSQALNGAQISSLLEIIIQTTAGVLTIASAKAITKSAFPSLSDQQINDIYDNLSNVDIDPTQVVQSIAEKKKDSTEIRQATDGYIPTDEMSMITERALQWRREYNRGGTEVGVARARDISNKRKLSLDTIQRMVNYFNRHEVDKKASGWNNGEDGFPSAGRIAWDLWGGDAGRDWAVPIIEREKKQQSKVVTRCNHNKEHFVSCSSDTPDMTDEVGDMWLSYLATKGELIDLDEWELVDEESVVDYDKEKRIHSMKQFKWDTKTWASPEDKSQVDTGVYKIRYKYSGGIKDNSRDFCIEMVTLSRSGVRYRYEDIVEMGNDGVNGSFAQSGSSEYSIWLFKGGNHCFHYWSREIWKRKKKNGKFLPNEGLDNDKKISVKEAVRDDIPLKDSLLDWNTAKTPTRNL